MLVPKLNAVPDWSSVVKPAGCETKTRPGAALTPVRSAPLGVKRLVPGELHPPAKTKRLADAVMACAVATTTAASALLAVVMAGGAPRLTFGRVHTTGADPPGVTSEKVRLHPPSPAQRA